MIEKSRVCSATRPSRLARVSSTVGIPSSCRNGSALARVSCGGMAVSARRIAGAVLVAFGIIALLWGGISWTERETIVDIGPIEATAEERETIPLPPVLGGIALAAGALLLFLPSRRRV